MRFIESADWCSRHAQRSARERAQNARENQKQLQQLLLLPLLRQLHATHWTTERAHSNTARGKGRTAVAAFGRANSPQPLKVLPYWFLLPKRRQRQRQRRRRQWRVCGRRQRRRQRWLCCLTLNTSAHFFRSMHCQLMYECVCVPECVCECCVCVPCCCCSGSDFNHSLCVTYAQILSGKRVLARHKY